MDGIIRGMYESKESLCPVCWQPSKRFILGNGRWHHHQECACIEVRIHFRLLTAASRLDRDEFPLAVREQIAEDARNAPSHKYVTLALNVGAIRSSGRRWDLQMRRRMRGDPPRP